MLPGSVIRSSSSMDDPFFRDATVLITELNADGAIGFVLNKLSGRSINELTEFQGSRPFPIYRGGPVDVEGLFFLHRRPDLIAGGALIGNDVRNKIHNDVQNDIRNEIHNDVRNHIPNDIYVGGSFAQVIKCINAQTLTEKDLRLFIGYCGWGPGELEAEFADGSWVLVDEVDQLDASLFNFVQ